MGESRFIRVRNLSKYQHYTKRNPIWIKWYWECLEDYDFYCLPDASKWLAVGLTMLATRMDNRIPANPQWIGGKLGCVEKVVLSDLLNIRFIEFCDDDSKMLANVKQDASGHKENREQRTELPPLNPPTGEKDIEKLFEKRFWPNYPRKEKKPAAYKAFRKILRATKPDQRESLLNSIDGGLQRWKDSGQWDDKQFIPHASTWLNNRRWEDEIVQARRNGHDPQAEIGRNDTKLSFTEEDLERMRPIAKRIRQEIRRLGLGGTQAYKLRQQMEKQARRELPEWNEAAYAAALQEES